MGLRDMTQTCHVVEASRSFYWLISRVFVKNEDSMYQCSLYGEMDVYYVQNVVQIDSLTDPCFVARARWAAGHVECKHVTKEYGGDDRSSTISALNVHTPKHQMRVLNDIIMYSINAVISHVTVLP